MKITYGATIHMIGSTRYVSIPTIAAMANGLNKDKMVIVTIEAMDEYEQRKEVDNGKSSGCTGDTKEKSEQLDDCKRDSSIM